MAFRTASFDTTAAFYAANVWTIDHLGLGWRLDGTMGAHQVSMSGLDGGSFAVAIRLPGDPTWKTHATAATEADTIIVLEPIISAIRFTAASLGGSAAPIVHITSRPRGFA